MVFAKKRQEKEVMDEGKESEDDEDDYELRTSEEHQKSSIRTGRPQQASAWQNFNTNALHVTN